MYYLHTIKREVYKRMHNFKNKYSKMDLKVIILNKISQTQKDKYCHVVSHSKPRFNIMYVFRYRRL